MVLVEANPITVNTHKLEQPPSIVPPTDAEEAAIYWVDSNVTTELKKAPRPILTGVAKETIRLKMHEVLVTHDHIKSPT